MTVKAAEVAPEATVTEAGVVSRLLLSETVTTVPPDGATELKPTVQYELAALLSVTGVHDNELRDWVAVPVLLVTVLPVAATEMAVPLADEADVFVIVMAVEVATVRFTVATTPFAIDVEFNP